MDAMSDKAATLVVVGVYDNPIDAEIAKSVLEGAGLFCALHGEYMSSIYTPVAFPSRLMVRDVDFEEAQALLRAREVEEEK